jgi:hypothetical protein
MRCNVWALGVALLLSSSPDALRATVQAQRRNDTEPVPTELRAYVERFTGPEPMDCGQHLLAGLFSVAGAKELQQGMPCVSTAAKDRKPFWTIKQEQGIDSLVFQGLLGTAEGAIFRFSYDSAPCGGPGCAGKFTIERCDGPTVVTDRSGRAQFECLR